MKDKIRDAYMASLMERVLDSGVAKEESVKKAAQIFMDDFSKFAKNFNEKMAE